MSKLEAPGEKVVNLSNVTCPSVTEMDSLPSLVDIQAMTELCFLLSTTQVSIVKVGNSAGSLSRLEFHL